MPIGYCGTGRDITGRRRAENELMLYKARLEDMVEERTAELARVSECLRREAAESQQAQAHLSGSEREYSIQW